MLPHWTKVRLTEDIACSTVEKGDEGVVIDSILIPNKTFYLVQVTDKEEIITAVEESLVNVDLN